MNVVLRYFSNALSARPSRFSISASSNAENSFSFSPVAGLIEAISIYDCSASVPACDPPSHASENAPATLNSQPLWNQNAIEHIEKPLHNQREHSCRNRAL